jgi:hypothetical protein
MTKHVVAASSAYILAVALLCAACASNDKAPTTPQNDAGTAGTPAASGGGGTSGTPASQAGVGAAGKPPIAGKPATAGNVAAGTSGSGPGGRAGGGAGGAAGNKNAAGMAGTAGAAGSSGGAPCDMSVCSANYPCQANATAYFCRGQFTDWPPAYAPAKFKVNADDTVTDSRSGLVWQRSLPATYAGCSAKRSSSGMVGEACIWAHAKAYCTGLTLAGTGWRLPTKAELESLIDDTRYSPAIDTTAFPATSPDPFWTSSASASSTTGDIWFIDFNHGMSSAYDVMGSHRVRCVR